MNTLNMTIGQRTHGQYDFRKQIVLVESNDQYYVEFTESRTCSGHTVTSKHTTDPIMDKVAATVRFNEEVKAMKTAGYSS